ncbi:CPBP family intramembrane glutamic endopeptidase [Pseudobacillus sp. FSL P4-0506]|uniref:CPBP family intramembrane glutamic endopeptidase n=1 Tax=unclassified Pseudobacillus TaxID=2619284 RepID=UPI0030FA9E74
MSILILESLLLAFLLLIYPFFDVKYTKSLKEKKDTLSRVRFFKFVIYSEWTIVAAILLMIVMTKITFKDMGITLPQQPHSEALGMIFGFLAGLFILLFVLMKIPAYQQRLNKQTADIDYLLPTTKQERRLSIFVAITAGVCEEIIYRGFVIHYLSSLPIDIQPMYIIIISAVIFGFGHIYQGWKGLLLTGFIGFIFARTYLATGSLLFPILLHIVIDMRSFLFVKPLPKENQTTFTRNI